MYKIIIFYKYLNIDNPQELRDQQMLLCQKLGLSGRIIVAKEGINATAEGTTESIQKYIETMKSDPRFADIHYKLAEGTGKAFPKLSVKARNEIVAARLGDDDLDASKIRGKYLTAEQLHVWLKAGKELYIVDMRNDYEQEVGHFAGSILTKMTSFADLPRVLDEIKHLKDKTVVTVCTAGVRCEKASGFLVKHGFSDVYQLYDGIVTYMEKYPNQDFKGALYVFDNRLIMGFNLDDPSREIVGKCAKCGKASEHFINCADHFCHRHFIICADCLAGKEAILCPMGCRDYSTEHPELFGGI